MNRSSALLIAVLLFPVLAGAAPLRGSVDDAAGLLSPQGAAQVEAAAAAFKAATGRRMVVIVRPADSGSAAGSTPGQEAPRAGVGIVYEVSPDDKGGRLRIVDPAWRGALPAQWSYLYPQHLAEKYGGAPFERRVVQSAQYLAAVLPDKIAFALKPRGEKLDPGSVRFARGSYIGLAILGYFIVFFTVFRTFWPSRLRDSDTDAFSNELRRLKKERQIW
jgi:hypothetical protein